MEQVESSASRHRHAVSCPVGGAGSQQPNPSVHQQQGCPPQAGCDATASPRPNPAPASQRTPVRGRLGRNYDASSMIHSLQLARHNADVDRAAAVAADSYEPEGQYEESCKQEPDESLRDYVRQFSKECNSLRNISVFLSKTTCKSLVHKLGRRKPRTTRDILDIAMNHASGEEAVGAVFNDGRTMGKAKR
ncbi:hypothetical protein C2845_PM18G06200 [Panicum miliaceum]|uniref:Uncharacterized protein n=1 Tax=Panicum miliaceum TaxID=4540 RepID=A0A3L6PI15_PANMI|nr:hypothetical protein C2845_PM18G06200 [Panicum miliaceum]